MIADARRFLSPNQYRALAAQLVPRIRSGERLSGAGLEKGLNVGNEILDLLDVAHGELPEEEADSLDAWLTRRLAS